MKPCKRTFSVCFVLSPALLVPHTHTRESKNASCLRVLSFFSFLPLQDRRALFPEENTSTRRTFLSHHHPFACAFNGHKGFSYISFSLSLVRTLTCQQHRFHMLVQLKLSSRTTFLSHRTNVFVYVRTPACLGFFASLSTRPAEA